jgi:hypothetical protein
VTVLALSLKRLVAGARELVLLCGLLNREACNGRMDSDRLIPTMYLNVGRLVDSSGLPALYHVWREYPFKTSATFRI